MINRITGNYSPYPFYQQHLVALLAPRIVASILCLRIKGLGNPLELLRRK
jgi:hypothetical protein